MAGSKKSAMLFLVAAVMWVVQAIISLNWFHDSTGALIACIVIFPLAFGILFAAQGGMRHPLEYQGSHYSPTSSTGVVDTYRVSKSSWQGAAYCGFCLGILSFVLVFAAGGELLEIFGITGVIYFLPGLIGGILAILASVVYRKEVEGPYFQLG